MTEKYDVVIIGAGIGGLVCGCYLAKAGLKVLIVEQHDKPGGCCTSFERKGFKFDVGVHYMGSLREGGMLFQILKELELLDRIDIITNDPIDRIITPDKNIFIRKDKNKTKEELIAHFPQEKEHIENFFNFILQKDFLSIVTRTKKTTFSKLLDSFFKDCKLKAILSIPLGNLGTSSYYASALASIIIYREFIFDGGYYPKGGVQTFPNLLARRFTEYGGNLLLSTEVIKIVTAKKKISGVTLANKKFISAKFIVSNADATLTFEKLLDCKSREVKLTRKLRTSPSAFIIYLGLNKELNIQPKHYTAWHFSTYDIEKCYNEQTDIINSPNIDYFLCTFSSLVDPTLAPHNKSVVRILVGAKYANKHIWDSHKENIYKKIMKKVNYVIPNIQDCIEIKEIATPCTINKFTSNRDGALFGWASTLNQIDRNIFPLYTSIENLYLVGHWVTSGLGQGGIAPTALSGRFTARMLIRSTKFDGGLL